jgi:cytochrome P450
MAGHETTSNSVSWALLELARYPEVQKRLRKEIRETARAVNERGDSGFTASDLDSMTYLNAVLKVDK